MSKIVQSVQFLHCECQCLQLSMFVKNRIWILQRDLHAYMESHDCTAGSDCITVLRCQNITEFELLAASFMIMLHKTTQW